MRVRIKDVAERAGVSTTMVSLYLNHHPLSARMAEKTKQRIDEAVRELNYQPSATARSLKKGKSKTLGLVIGEIAGVNSSFYSQMLLEEAEKYDYQLLISLTRYSREQELKCLQNLFSRQAFCRRAMLVKMVVRSAFPEYLRNYPILLTHYRNPVCNSFTVSYREGMRKLFAELGARGIRRVLTVAENPLAAADREGIVPEDVVFAGCKFPDKNLAGILEEARRVNAECLVFFSSVHARRFLLCCKENGVREIPLVVNSYTLPYDYFEHPRVIGALVSPFREHVAGEMRRMIEMIENQVGLAQGDYARVVGRSERLLAVCEGMHYALVAMHIRIQTAAAYEMLGKHAEAQAQLDQALTDAEPDGFVIPFAENYRYLKPLLAERLQTGTVAQIIELGEAAERRKAGFDRPEALSALTEREYEIVRLMAQRLNNREIAEKLYLSEGSVRQYVNQIYAKLCIEGEPRAKRKRLLELLEGAD